MRPRRNTLLHGAGCTCNDCHAEQLVIAVSLLAVAAAGLVWLLWGTA